jgi:conjugative relaxase-like TrwC/TraI family protein
MLAQPKTGGTQKGFNYHEEENYYQVGQESGQFYGKLAEELGFTQLDRESLLNALEGNNAAGEKMVKTRSDGIDENGYRKNAYTDLTFTIDKSLSVAYENAIKNDAALAQKIAACHQSAVRRTLDYVEKEYIYSRKETKAQDKALFMIYDHHESRMVDNKIDPSLHSHALLVGITQNENGTYNKLDNSHIMLDHQMIGLLYRNEVALLLQKEGIEIEVHDAKQGFYQTKGFSKEAREEFSQRSQQISKWVKENEARIKETYPNITNKQLRDLGQKATRGFKDKELDLT